MKQEKVQRESRRGLLLGMVIFIMGGCGLAYEYTFSKFASDLLGNSVQQWAIVIGVMLFCMGMGAEIQRLVKPQQVLRVLVLSQIALALLGGFGPLCMLFSFAYEPYYFGLVYYGVVSLIGVLIGFEIPLISRLNENYSADIRSNLARVLKMDYIGALAGAIMWIFVLPKFFTIHQIAYVLGFVSLLAVLLCLLCFRHQQHTTKGMYVGIAIAGAALGVGVSQTQGWSAKAEQRLFSDRVILAETTPYQHIVVTESLSGHVRCYINGHIQFSSYDEALYHENLVHPVMSLVPGAARVLILGGGDGLALREVLKYPEVEEVILVDLDPAMTKLASEHPLFIKLNAGSLKHANVVVKESRAVQADGTQRLIEPHQRRIQRRQVFEQGPEISVRNIDAAAFAREPSGLFDVIILDFPDPSAPELAKLYSQHFYGALKSKLSAEGCMVQQATSPDRAKEAFLCIGRTLNAAGFSTLPYHDHVPSFGEWGWWIARHEERVDVRPLKEEILELDALISDTRYLSLERLKANLVFGKAGLDSIYTDITTIAHPAVLNHYLSGWRE